MVSEEIELTDADIVVIQEEWEVTQPGRSYGVDLDYGSDPQLEPPERFESSWNEGEDTEPLKEVR